MTRLTKVVSAERSLDATSRGGSQGSDVAPGQIDNVYEVSYSRSIWGVPVGTEDVQDWFSARQDGGDNGDQVAWFLPRIFT